MADFVLSSQTILKEEDVLLIVNQLEISRAKSEKALRQAGGDVARALTALVR